MNHSGVVENQALELYNLKKILEDHTLLICFYFTSAQSCTDKVNQAESKEIKRFQNIFLLA